MVKVSIQTFKTHYLYNIVMLHIVKKKKTNDQQTKQKLIKTTRGCIKKICELTDLTNQD